MRRAVLAVVVLVLGGAVAGAIVHVQARGSRELAAAATRLAIVDKLNHEEEGATAQAATRPGKPWALEPRTFPAAASKMYLAAGAPTFGQPTIVGIQGVGFEEDL